MKKKLLSIVLALSMLCAFVPLVASAEVATSGTCGENLTWTLGEDGTLTISGTGDMYDYYNDFFGQSKIKNVIIKNGVTSIGNSAFEICGKLTSIEIPNSVTSIGNRAFNYCRSLTSIKIPNSVKSIGDSTFEDCSSLTSVEISNSVTSIDDYMFRNCEKLISIEIPNSVKSIDDYAFEDCSSLTNIEIPNSVKSIGDGAFEHCNNLTSIEIPNSVMSIGNRALSYCQSLTSINVDKDNSKYYSIDGNLFNKDKLILIQYALGKTEKSYIVPNGVTSIGAGAFEYCEHLTSIEIPNSVTSIGAGTFEHCENLTSIKIPNGIKNIGDYAFENCLNLIRIEIPNSVTKINERAFRKCTDLTDVYYNGTKKQWNEINIGNYNDDLKNATIHYKRDIPLTTATIKTEKVGEAYTFNVEPEQKYEDCYVYAAMYDENGLLTGFNRVPLETSGSTNISVGKTDNAESAKVFILSDMLQPVIATQEFTLE